MNKKDLTVKFRFNKKTITPASKKSVFKSGIYDIFSTHLGEYFIKVYHHPQHKKNKYMSKQFVKFVEKLSKLTSFNISVYDIQEQPPYSVVLMESYQHDLNSLIKVNFLNTRYDIYKFLYQMSLNLIYLRDAEIQGFLMDRNTVVLDLYNNYQLTHFDINLNNREEFGKLFDSKFFLKKPLAPEFFEGNSYDIKSHVWDLGVLTYSVLSAGDNPKINYKNRTVEFNEKFTENKFLKGFLENALKFNKDERISIENVRDMIKKELGNFKELFITKTLPQNA